MRNRHYGAIFWWLVLGLSLGGCVGPIKPFPALNAAALRVQPLVRIEQGAPFALSADGRWLAFAEQRLNLRDIESADQLELEPLVPDAMSWSMKNELAVSMAQEGQALLRLYSVTGERLFEQPLPGRVSRLQWSEDGTLTAGVLERKTYRFGTHLTAWLYQWNEKRQLKRWKLFESTINPAVAAQQGDHLFRLFDFDLSPLGDEVLLTRIFAPPAFAPARRLMLYHLATRKTQILDELPLTSGSARLGAEGETLFVAKGAGQISQRRIWFEHLDQQWPGENFSFSPRAQLLLIDNRLYNRKGLLLELPPLSQPRFSAGGRYLLVLHADALYRIGGYPRADLLPFEPRVLKKLLQLRRLRSLGLIEPRDYSQARERLVPR